MLDLWLETWDWRLEGQGRGTLPTGSRSRRTTGPEALIAPPDAGGKAFMHELAP